VFDKKYPPLSFLTGAAIPADSDPLGLAFQVGCAVSLDVGRVAA
jgi:hypothetical protein